MRITRDLLFVAFSAIALQDKCVKAMKPAEEIDWAALEAMHHEVDWRVWLPPPVNPMGPNPDQEDPFPEDDGHAREQAPGDNADINWDDLPDDDPPTPIKGGWGKVRYVGLLFSPCVPPLACKHTDKINNVCFSHCTGYLLPNPNPFTEPNKLNENNRSWTRETRNIC